MPGYRGHIVGGSFLYIILLILVSHFVSFSSYAAVRWALLSLIGALFPDIDTKSKGQLFVYRGLFILLLMLIYTRQWPSVSLIALCAFLPLMVRHRGLFHRLWFVSLVVGVCVVGLSHIFPICKNQAAIDAVFFLGGVASHLFLDRIF